jgi:signal transduction histidine kinase
VLADFLSQHPEIARDVDKRTVAHDWAERPAKSRRERLKALLAELVDVLEHGHVEEPGRTPPVVNGEAELRERELLRNDILEKLESSHVEAPGRELMVLADWVWTAEHARLTEIVIERSALLDLCPDAAAIVTLDGHIRYVNTAMARLVHTMTGLSPDAIIGKTGKELGFWVAAGPSPGEFRNLARTHAVSEIMVVGRWHELRAKEICGVDGAVQAIALLMADVHERKLAAIRLEVLSKLTHLVGTLERDELWKAMTQVPIPQLADWCAVNTIENRRIKATFIGQSDPSTANLRDKLVRAANGMEEHPLWREMLSTGFQLLSEVSDELLRKLVPDEELYQLVARIGIRSLMVVPVVSRGDLVAIITLGYTDQSRRRYGQDDPALGVALALHAAHIAENARLVAEAKSSEARFRIALAEARTIVYEQDESLRYTWHFAPDLPSYIGRTHADVLPPEEAAALTKLKQRVLDTGEPASTEMELSFAGKRRWYRHTIEAVRDRLGRRTGVIGAATDFTEQKQAQQELNLAVELRDRVMGVLGHDLRNPLGATTLAAKALRLRDDLPADANRLVVVIDRASRRMSEMIDTLLDFTRVRVSAQPLPIVRGRCDLAEIAQEIVEESRAGAPGRTIELEIQGDTESICDAPRIGQALSNLLGNALSYGDKTKPVLLSIEGMPAQIRLRVHNEGPAIPEWLLPVLFDPFVRGKPDVVSPHGLGLGLFVVKEIVRSHGGSIDVVSTAAAGTTFTIHLPRS